MTQQSWIGAAQLYLNHSHVQPTEPGAPIVVWMQAGNLAQIEDLPPAGFNVFNAVKANQWFYSGSYRIAYRGETFRGELVGVLDPGTPTAKEWTRVMKGRGHWEANDETGLVRGRQTTPAEQLNADPRITLGFVVLECVGYNLAGLRSWVENRRTLRPK